MLHNSNNNNDQCNFHTYKLPDKMTTIQNKYDFPADTYTTDGSTYSAVMPQFESLYLKADQKLQKELDNQLKGYDSYFSLLNNTVSVHKSDNDFGS